MNSMGFDIQHARTLVNACEHDLRRTLGDGERRDLLADNTDWTTAYIRLVVAELEESGT